MRVDREALDSFRRDGYAVVPDVLTKTQIIQGRRLVADLLEQDPPPAGHAGPYSLWPRFSAAGHPLLVFYHKVGLPQLAEELLRADLDVQDPEFAQIATTMPHWRIVRAGPTSTG